jgi:hypothetical protein
LFENKIAQKTTKITSEVIIEVCAVAVHCIPNVLDVMDLENIKMD